MTNADGRTLAQEAERLAVAVDKLNEDMADQVTALSLVAKRNRFLIEVLGVVVALLILVSVGLGFVALQTNRALDTAEQNRSNARLTCLVSNETRAAQIQLWEYVLSLPTGPQTPERKERIRQFRLYLNQVFAPRNCDDLSVRPTTPPPPSR
jgi:hypothetical protein